MWRFSIYLYNVGMSIYFFNIFFQYVRVFSFPIVNRFFSKKPLVTTPCQRWGLPPGLVSTIGAPEFLQRSIAQQRPGNRRKIRFGSGEFLRGKCRGGRRMKGYQIVFMVKNNADPNLGNDTVYSPGFFCFHSLPDFLKGNRKRRAEHVFRVEVGMGVHMWLPLGQHPPIY